MSTTPENTGRHVAHLLPALLTGGLSPTERKRVTDHVRECAQCGAELGEWMVIGAAVDHTTNAVAAPPRLARDLMDRLLPAPAGRAQPAAGLPLFGALRRTEAGRLGGLMAASLGATALIASNSGLAQQVLLRNHITADYYLRDSYEYQTSPYGQPIGAFATPSPAATSTTTPTPEPSTGGGTSPTVVATTASGNNANPLAPGQTGLNPGQSGGVFGPPGQTGANPGQQQGLGTGRATVTLENGRTISVTLPSDVVAALGSLAGQVSISFVPGASSERVASTGSTESIGGVNATLLGRPLEFKLTLAAALTDTQKQLVLDTLFDLALPYLVSSSTFGVPDEREVRFMRISPLDDGGVLPMALPQELPPGSDFQWLRELKNEDGTFAGYIVEPTEFDPGAPGGPVKRMKLPGRDLQDTLFVPAILTQSFVQNHNPSARIFSGPLANSVDLGVAAPQFTTFVVVAPQVRDRLFVFNPATLNYGWIDVAGIGPAGPPAR